MTSTEITATTVKFTVVFDGDNWTAFPDGAEIPENWTVWATGLSWEEAHAALTR